MSFATGTTRIFRSGLLAIAMLGLWVMLASGSGSLARAQSDEPTGYAVGATVQGIPPDQNAATDPNQNDPNAAANQQAHDAADAAAEALDSATEARDQLESDGAEQDQIDAANQAVAKARYEKEQADAAAQKADEAANQ